MTVAQIQSRSSWWSCHSCVVSAMLTMLSSYSQYWEANHQTIGQQSGDPPCLFVCQSVSQSVGRSACQSASRSARSQSVGPQEGRHNFRKNSQVNFSRNHHWSCDTKNFLSRVLHRDQTIWHHVALVFKLWLGQYKPSLALPSLAQVSLLLIWRVETQQ